MFPWPRSTILRISQTAEPNRTVLCLKGNATSDMAPLWQNEFLRLTTQRWPLIVLEMSELASISNLFLTSVERLVDCQQRHGGRVKLLSPRPVVREMLELCELGHLVDWDGESEDDHSGIVRSRS